ncbi:MAG TPA: hypothetical protein PLF26_02355 [Blastocatellia bacterium]|nr:hypothetical protein [Blastocatellia bacterium]
MNSTLLAALIVLGSIVPSPHPVRADGESHPRDRHVIICIDGVGFATFEEMRAEGKFRQFHEPARMIATFPSLTDISLTAILAPAGARPARGYEDAWFDPSSQRVRGGLVDRFRQDRFVRGTFRELFDYHPSAIKSGLAFGAPPASTYIEAATDVAMAGRKARQSNDPVFFAYVAGSDTLAHVGGERMLRSLLARLDATATSLLREGQGHTTVTIFSDHGNEFRSLHRVSLKGALRRAGLAPDSRLRSPASVVSPSFGLIGCVVLYTAERNEPVAAHAVANVKGVDFAAYEHDGVVTVVGPTGTATIERREDRFRYRMVSGDPLWVAPALGELRARGAVDADGFANESDWFAATCESARPDAVRRVYEGLTRNVATPANVLVALADGWYAGNPLLDVFAFMQATHGNAGRGASLGFVATTDRDLPRYLAAGDVWQAIGAPRIARSPAP